MTSLSAQKDASSPRFHTFDVSSQVFLSLPHTLGIVNLKPIVPLHVLLITRTPYERVGQVPKAELSELFGAVQDVSNVVQALTGSTSCTISIQDGKEAGQSVPHVHVHILPRKSGDFTPKDVIYQHLEAFGVALQRDMQNARRTHDQTAGNGDGVWAVDADEDRKPRSNEEMAKEAAWLGTYFSS